jgi:hypothetical protein
MATIYDAVVQSGKIIVTISGEDAADIPLREYIQSGAVNRAETFGPYSAKEFRKISKTW